jgi:hypothetical protein
MKCGQGKQLGRSTFEMQTTTFKRLRPNPTLPCPAPVKASTQARPGGGCSAAGHQLTWPACQAHALVAAPGGRSVSAPAARHSPGPPVLRVCGQTAGKGGVLGVRVAARVASEAVQA